MDNQERKPKIYEKSPTSGIAVPIAIVLVGALIIFGVTSMLSDGKGYQDLVRDLNSKTFGNRWVAAYELSKYINSKKIPAEDVSWLIDNLNAVYESSQDPRTRNFIVLALSALRDERTFPIIEKALQDSDDKVRFNAVVAIGNTENEKVPADFDWQVIFQFLNSQDMGLKQVSAVALAIHQVPESEQALEELMRTEQAFLRYTAATALIYFRSEQSQKIVREIFDLPAQTQELNAAQVEQIKLNVINALQKTGWDFYTTELQNLSKNDANVKISTKARETLNLLKK